MAHCVVTLNHCVPLTGPARAGFKKGAIAINILKRRKGGRVAGVVPIRREEYPDTALKTGNFSGLEDSRAMNREETVRILSAHRDAIRQRGITRLALFGSTVRDQDGENSDVDLLIDVDRRRRFSLLDHAGLEAFFEDLLGQPVDVVFSDRLKPFLRDNILAEAVEIYPKPSLLPDSARDQPLPPRIPRQRLEDMNEAIAASERFVAGRSFADFQADRMLQLALERNIEIVSEASRHLPDTIKNRHPSIPWRKVRDIGNVLRHGYEIVDPKVIWTVITQDLTPLKVTVEAMIEDVDGSPEAGS